MCTENFHFSSPSVTLGGGITTTTTQISSAPFSLSFLSSAQIYSHRSLSFFDTSSATSLIKQHDGATSSPMTSTSTTAMIRGWRSFSSPAPCTPSRACPQARHHTPRPRPSSRRRSTKQVAVLDLESGPRPQIQARRA